MRLITCWNVGKYSKNEIVTCNYNVVAAPLAQIQLSPVVFGLCSTPVGFLSGFSQMIIDLSSTLVNVAAGI